MFTFRRFRTFARLLALGPLLALGAGCSHDSPTDFGDNDPSIVVALGDSITFGIFDTGVNSCSESFRSTAGFCPRLAGLAGKTVINEGRCGEKSGEGLRRISTVLQRWRPGVILIDYSPNDVFEGSPETIRNLREMIAIARANKTYPILGTLVPATGEHESWEPFIEDLNSQIRALCDEEDVPCADHHLAFKSNPAFLVTPYALLAEDGLHPNGAGYEVMAETWRDPLMRQY